MKYFINWQGKQSFFAGPKAKRDISYFWKKEGIISIDFPKSKYLKLIYLITIFPFKILKVGSKSIIFVQFPFANKKIRKIIFNLIKIINVKLVFLIHDIESLRVNINDDFAKLAELKELGYADGIISLTNSMSKWLKIEGLNIPIVNLDIWDYKNNNLINENQSYNKTVCFAGNLDKSEFLKKWEPKYKINLYGPISYKDKLDKNLIYEDSYSPEKLPKYLNQNFGLVWDGNSTKSCSGVFGKYLEYNIPHKTSLYLSCGIPVIIWSKAAIAPFLVENKVAITIDSLEQLDSILDNITNSEYQELKTNAINLGNKIRNGYFIKQATDKIISKLNN